MSNEQPTAVEQMVELIRDAMDTRARDAGSAADGYCPIEDAYERAANQAKNLCMALEDVRRVGGRV